MAKVIVFLKNGSQVEVEGADSAEWMQDLIYPGATHENRHVVRLVCKQGDRIMGRFDTMEVIGYAVDIR